MPKKITAIKDYWYMNNKLLDMITNCKYVPYKLKKYAKHKVGSTYWIGYWEKTYTVLEINDNKIKVVWDDGKVTEHMTSLDYIHDYELKPFEYKSLQINSQYSHTAAEIKALVYNYLYEWDNMAINNMIEKYFNNNQNAPNDYVYYFVDFIPKDGYFKPNLRRDLKRSPHNFSNIKTLRHVYADNRLENAKFIDKNDVVINSIPLSGDTKVLSIEPGDVFKCKYVVKLDVEIKIGGI